MTNILLILATAASLLNSVMGSPTSTIQQKQSALLVANQAVQRAYAYLKTNPIEVQADFAYSNLSGCWGSNPIYLGSLSLTSEKSVIIKSIDVSLTSNSDQQGELYMDNAKGVLDSITIPYYNGTSEVTFHSYWQTYPYPIYRNIQTLGGIIHPGQYTFSITGIYSDDNIEVQGLPIKETFTIDSCSY